MGLTFVQEPDIFNPFQQPFLLIYQIYITFNLLNYDTGIFQND